MTDQEAHDALSKMAREHIPLGGVNPPTDEEAAAGTMKDADPEEDPRNVALAKAAGPGGFDALAPSPRNAALAEAAGPGGFDALAPDETKPGGTLANTVKSNVAALTTATPRPALTQPLGYRPPAAPKDPELEQLQANAKDRRSTAQLGQAVTDFNERPTNLLDYAERLGGGGTSAPPKKSTVWSDYEAEGEQPLKDLQARRASAAALRVQQAAAAGDADDSDPNSPRARVLRSILYKYNPDLAGQLDTATPKQLTAIGGPELTKMIEESGALEREKNKPDPKAAAAADKAAQAESTRKLLLGPAYREQMKKEGHTPEEIAGMDDEGLKGLREHFEHDATNKATVTAGDHAAYRGEAIKKEAADAADAKSKPLVETIAQAVASGQMPVPTKTTPNAEAITARALEINPNLDIARAETHRHVMENQATNPQRIATELAHEHMEELRKAVAATPDISDLPFWNDVKQGVAAKSGDPKYKALRMAANQVAAEVTNAYGEHNVEGQHITRELLNPNQSKEQWKSSLDEAEKLLSAKKNIYEKTAAESAPTSKPAAGKPGGHGAVTFEGDGLREYADGFVEEVK